MDAFYENSPILMVLAGINHMLVSSELNFIIYYCYWIYIFTWDLFQTCWPNILFLLTELQRTFLWNEC